MSAQFLERREIINYQQKVDYVKTIYANTVSLKLSFKEMIRFIFLNRPFF